MNPIISEVLANKHCANCLLSKREKIITIRNKTLEINKCYVPCNIKTLFVAESPPTMFYEQPSRYFYASGSIKYGTLFYNTMTALFEDSMKNYRMYSKEYFLNKFQENGFYLIDMVKCPINKLSEEEKEKAIEFCSEYVKRELKYLQFQRVIFIGKSSFKKAERYLPLNFKPTVIPLPFGSKRNVEDFKKELKRNMEVTDSQF